MYLARIHDPAYADLKAKLQKQVDKQQTAAR